MKATRDGFGEGLVAAGTRDQKVVAVTADLGSSTKLGAFGKKWPSRLIQVGVAEQNLATVASGLAHVGFIPFVTSFAMFNPGRNWEQIRTTICYNNQNVKIVGTHSGLGVGEDGATHQALEDIALMRSLPNMDVVVPCDAMQAYKATLALARTKRPAYLRLGRQQLPDLTDERLDFAIGKAQVVRKGRDVTLVSCGSTMHLAVSAAATLEEKGVDVHVLNMHTIKPFDEKALISAARKTGAVVSVEDHQVTGGLGGAIAEVLSSRYPIPLYRLGVQDCFGQSGTDADLFSAYGLTSQAVVAAVQKVMKKQK